MPKLKKIAHSLSGREFIREALPPNLNTRGRAAN